ncbi:hypothetical protein MUP59_08250 [Candidatus Bathyarchaeota archaeon]|nr:hypothetical protein [Candidatus Bathyarchaeota archaeon]
MDKKLCLMTVILCCVILLVAIGGCLSGAPAHNWASDECFKMGYGRTEKIDGVWYCYNSQQKNWGASSDLVGIPVRLGRYEDK